MSGKFVILKAFQNPVEAEMVKAKLKEILAN